MWWRGGGDEPLDPILATTGYLGDPGKHRDAHTQWEDSGVAWPDLRRQAPEEIVGSRDDKIQQSRKVTWGSPRHGPGDLLRKQAVNSLAIMTP